MLLHIAVKSIKIKTKVILFVSENFEFPFIITEPQLKVTSQQCIQAFFYKGIRC